MSIDKLSPVLAIDTVGRAGALAFIGNENSEVVKWNEKASHTVQLPKAIEQLKYCSIGDTQGISVSAGPGGFSSIRTGLAFAKGLCAARGISMFVVSTLEALAIAEPVNGSVAVFCSASRGSVFFQSFMVVDGKASHLNNPTMVSKDDISMIAGQSLDSIVAGDDQVFMDCESAIADRSVLRPSLEQRVLSVGRIGQSRLMNRESDDWIDAEPMYVRQVDVTKPKTGWST